ALSVGQISFAVLRAGKMDQARHIGEFPGQCAAKAARADIAQAKSPGQAVLDLPRQQKTGVLSHGKSRGASGPDMSGIGPQGSKCLRPPAISCGGPWRSQEIFDKLLKSQ